MGDHVEGRYIGQLTVLFQARRKQADELTAGRCGQGEDPEV